MNINAITVKQLNFYVKSLLEGDIPLQSIALTGEISNFKNHYASGHFYFTLKDSAASVRCVMFKSAARFVDFEPEDGCQVVLIGRVSLYEKDHTSPLHSTHPVMPHGLQRSRTQSLCKTRTCPKSLYGG